MPRLRSAVRTAQVTALTLLASRRILINGDARKRSARRHGHQYERRRCADHRAAASMIVRGGSSSRLVKSAATRPAERAADVRRPTPTRRSRRDGCGSRSARRCAGRARTARRRTRTPCTGPMSADRRAAADRRHRCRSRGSGTARAARRAIARRTLRAACAPSCIATCATPGSGLPSCCKRTDVADDEDLRMPGHRQRRLGE